MARDLKTKLIRKISLGLFALFFIACNSTEPRQDDFYGIWTSERNDTLQLYEDGRCHGIIRQSFSPDVNKEEQVLNIKNGTWKFSLKDNLNRRPTIKITDNNKNFSFSMFVSGTNGFLNNTPPWYIYWYIGDPDEEIRNKFYKIE